METKNPLAVLRRSMWQRLPKMGFVMGVLVISFFLYRETTQVANLTPTNVRIECSRNVKTHDVSCELTEIDTTYKQKIRQLAISGVNEITYEGPEYTTFFLSTAESKVPIATVNLRRLHPGVDSEKLEPLASLNRLQKFMATPAENAVSVQFDQPLL